MSKLKTSYLGLQLKNPLIVGSSGLTNSVEKIKKLEAAGAGAVVLKSLFEEQILHETKQQLRSSEGLEHPEALDYIQNYNKKHSVNKYLELIKGAKRETQIPIIASINCFSADQWLDFAQQIEAAGADALELNVFVVNTDKNSVAAEYEEIYYKIARGVSKVINIPVAIKLSPYFSNLVQVIDKLSISGAKGVVLFNRFYEPDIDINKMSLVSAEVFSSPSDIRQSLRWVALVSNRIKGVDVAASTGVHDGEAVIKLLLAGATAVQTCSAVYKNGPAVVTKMLKRISEWMDEKEYNSIDEFRGTMSYSAMGNSAMYERAQFMKYFSEKE